MSRPSSIWSVWLFFGRILIQKWWGLSLSQERPAIMEHLIAIHFSVQISAYTWSAMNPLRTEPACQQNATIQNDESYTGIHSWWIGRSKLVVHNITSQLQLVSSRPTWSISNHIRCITWRWVFSQQTGCFSRKFRWLSKPWVDTCQTTLKLKFSALHLAAMVQKSGKRLSILDMMNFCRLFFIPEFWPSLPHHQRSPTWSCITSTRAGALTARRRGASALDRGACRRCRWQLGASKPDSSTAGLLYDLCIYTYIYIYIHIYNNKYGINISIYTYINNNIIYIH